MQITKRKALLIAILITLANIIGKLLGFGRDVLISYYYGASAITDSIFLAMSIPMLILGVFTNSTDSAIIPQYNRIANLKGKEYADIYFSNVVNIVSIIAFMVSVFIFIFPDFFISVFAPGFNEQQIEYSKYFLRMFSFFGFMHVFYCFFSTYNTIYTRVVPRAILSFTTNLLVVIALLSYPDPQMRMLSIAYLIGSILSGIIPVISALSKGYKHQIKSLSYDGEMKTFVKIFLPIMGVALLVNLNMFVDRFLASNMGTGSVSYINYASRLTSIFDSMLIVGLGVVILPVLSQSKINNDITKFNRNATQVIKLLTIILLPIMTLSMIVSSQIIETIYMRGEFGVEAVLIVSSVFFWYAPQILALPLQATMAKIFHSIEDTKTPFYINTICVGINIILSIFLSTILGIKGIAIATSLSVILSVYLLINKMKKQIGWDSSTFGAKDLLKIAFCLAISILFAKVSIKYVSGSFLETLIVGVSGGLTYFILFAIMMKKDFHYLLSFTKRGK